MSEPSPPNSGTSAPASAAGVPLATAPTVPSAAISYAWDDAAHQEWVKTELAARLWNNGVRASLDRWNLAPGFSLTQFMEGLVRDNQFALVVCTPKYKTRADNREGGVGYETDLMTAARLKDADPRRFIAILRRGDRDTAVPSWLEGRVDVDLHGEPGEPAYEAQFDELLRTLHDFREQPPVLGQRPFPAGPNIAPSPPRRGAVAAAAAPAAAPRPDPTARRGAAASDETVRILGLSITELRGAPVEESDGTTPITLSVRLSQTPTTTWGALFADAWDHLHDAPPGHRPRMARVAGNRIVLAETTARELREVHRASLDTVVRQVNEAIARMTSGEEPG